ncbi:MAG: ABC transporter permease [Candidatus Binatia bacterium]|nr:MAG: ABC transporter permease [Candidatus Binatia bacterium]
MGYELFIALRYLLSRRQGSFGSWSTVTSALGLFVGVLTLNVVLAVYTGFEEELRERILGFHPHLVVLSFTGTIGDPEAVAEKVRAEPQVRAVAPFVLAQGMLTAGQDVRGVLVRGITARSEEVMPLSRFLRAGSLAPLYERGNEDPGAILPIVIGKGVAEKLHVAVGDHVELVSPAAQSTAVGLVPHVQAMRVVGIFDSGLGEYDGVLAFMGLPEAQRLFRFDGRVTGLEVRLSDVYEAPRLSRELSDRLGFPYRVRNWIDLNRNLFSALTLGKIVYSIVLLLIVLVAAFNIVSTLIMVVMEKRKDLAILLSMGATRASVRRIFVGKGMIIGSAGTVAGSLAGYVVCLLIRRYRFVELPADVYAIDRLAVRIYPEYFLLVAVVALLLCWLATLYPARQAARLSPVEVIRYE